MSKRQRSCWGLLLVLLGSLPSQAQSGDYAGLRPPINPTFGLGEVQPLVQKVFSPRYLPGLDDAPWRIEDTRYARSPYRRYLNAQLEGEQWYNRFGDPVERGWLLYEWNQVQADPKGSSIWKSAEYRRLFQSLVIASDHSRDRHYRLMVGDAIHSSFTPLTFGKPRFNGMRMDWATDRQQATLILARPSMGDQDQILGTAIPSARTNFTNLVGGHAEVQVGPIATLGFTYVNAHHGQTKQEMGAGSPFRGYLTTDQNIPLKTLYIRLGDDSPADERGGALLFDYDIVLVDTSGRQLRGRQIGFFPTVEGGRIQGNRLSADGSETLLLTYDLSKLDYEGLQTADLKQVKVEMSVANDYRIEIASDRQNTGEARRAQPVFLVVRRAPGNVQDNSNAQVIQLDYGLPTATEVIGLNAQLSQWKGLSMQGEVALSRQHRSYPNPGIRDLHDAVDQTGAAYLQAGIDRYPWGFSLELFSTAAGYSTSAWISEADGKVRYNDPTTAVYEFVEDDDDFNGVPEWQRRSQAWSDVAWPGYDENVDFLRDANENNNLLPDYDEPFLRFRSDRPELLPGLDMNYNGTIDRFENDLLPDYPYKPDHRGLNLFGTANLGPELSLSLGHQRLNLTSGSGRTRAFYLLGRGTFDWSGWGRLRVFEHLVRERDNIPDPLRQWVQPYGQAGRMREMVDRLPGRDAWVQTLYADWDQRVGPAVHLQHRMRWEGRWQQSGTADLQERRAAGFWGLVDRVEWGYPLGLAMLEPRWKSEYRREQPFDRRLPEAESLEETLFLLWTQPLLAEKTSVSYFARYGRQLLETEMQLGLERSWFDLLHGRYDGVEEGFTSWAFIAQFSNRTAYEGYKLVTLVGFEMSRRTFRHQADQDRNLLFFSVNAALR
ncbi:MAG: hypothetical protein IT369_24370 [Candidatus Latescibacteria bacterium]|nr:hypothetical protein [Candidatus Latescibacterota bacterium]